MAGNWLAGDWSQRAKASRVTDGRTDGWTTRIVAVAVSHSGEPANKIVFNMLTSPNIVVNLDLIFRRCERE